MNGFLNHKGEVKSIEYSFLNAGWCNDRVVPFVSSGSTSPSTGGSTTMTSPEARVSVDSEEDKKPIIRRRKKKTKIHYSELPQNVCPTVCAVCGDAATGYHYEVASCNGCKTFFRRTVLTQREYVCTKDGKCFETMPFERRCDCRACRFQQCVAVGMNPLAIHLTREIEDNDIIKQIVKRKAIDCQPSCSREVKLSPTLPVFEDSVERLLDQLIYLDIKTDQLRKSMYNPNPTTAPTLEEMLSRPNILSSSSPEIVKPMPNWPLKQREIPKFHPAAFKDKDPPPDPPPIEKERKHWMYFDLMCSVEYAKTFSCFNQLSKDDKIRLLKNVALLCSNLTTGFFSYMNHSDGVLHPDGTHPPGGFKTQKIVTVPLIRIKIDQKEYVLLKAVLLCNSAVTDLSSHGQAVLMAERDKYGAALLSYCMAARGPVDGPAHFSALLALADVLQHQARDLKDIHFMIKMKLPPHLNIQLLDDIMG